MIQMLQTIATYNKIAQKSLSKTSIEQIAKTNNQFFLQQLQLPQQILILIRERARILNREKGIIMNP
jgi:hypothetical protein